MRARYSRIFGLVSVVGAAAACASNERWAPLRDYSDLECRSLNASYESIADGHADLSSVPRLERFAQPDPLLGWKEEIDRELAWCRGETRLPEWDRDCKFVRRHFDLLAMMQELPLRRAPAELTAFRAIWAHDDATKVMVRAVATSDTKVLVAKVVAADVPLGWLSVRHLSDKEWQDIVRVMHGLPKGTEWFFGPPYLAQKLRLKRMGCASTPHRASMQIERYENGELQIMRDRYAGPTATCSGPCCDPLEYRTRYKVSRVVDHMISLVRCAK